MYKNNTTGILGVIITVVLLIILVIFSNINLEKLSSVESAINKIFVPIQNAFVMLKNKAKAIFDDIGEEIYISISHDGDYATAIALIK